MEKIINIEYIDDIDREDFSDQYGISYGHFYSDNIDYPRTMEGFVIKTDKQQIFIGIDNEQQCCEEYGSICTNDNIKDYIGAIIKNISIVDTTHNKSVLKKFDDIMNTDENRNGDRELYVEFVDIETDKGLLQFSVYNIHNGYYGHQVVIIFNEKTHSIYM